MRRWRLVSIFVLLAACAPATEWAKVEMTPQQRSQDERDCQAMADYQAFDESFGTTAKYPPYRDTQFLHGGGDEGGGGFTVTYSQRGPRVYELAEYCMQQRGYALRRLKA